MKPSALFPKRLFYGWVVVAAAFLLMFTGFGVAYSFPAYFDTFIREFGVDRASVSFVFALFGLLYFTLGALTGVLTDRFGPRLLAAFAAVCVVVGLLLASWSTEMWQVYLTFSLFVGLAVSATYVPSISTVQRWFLRRRGLASGLAVSGIGVGTVAGQAAAAWLLENVGWRQAYVITGIVAAVLTLVAGWLLLRSPVEVGSGPDGDPMGPQTSALRGRLTPTDRTVGEAVRTREFIALYIVIAFTCFPVFFGFLHIAPFAMDAGLDPTIAPLIGVGGIGVGSAAGRLLLSPLADRLGRKRTYALTVAAIAALMVGWLFLPGDQVVILAIFAFLFGTAYGGFVSLCPAMMADYFGTSYVSGTIGVFYTGAGIGAFLGPLFGGYIFDQYGAYTWAILTGAVLTIVATVIVMWLRDPIRVKAQWAPAVSMPAPPILSGPPPAREPVAATTRRVAATANVEPAGPVVVSAAPAAPTWAEWLAIARARELRLAGEFAALAHRTADPALAEVLEIAEARTRDRAFLLRRAGAPAEPDAAGGPLRRPPDTAPALARVETWLDRLNAYDESLHDAPDPDAAALLDRLRLSERETADLLRDERERLIAEAYRQAVRIRPGAAARMVGESEAYWKILTPAGPARTPVARVVQMPGTAVHVAPAGEDCLLLGESGRGRVRDESGRDLPCGAGQAIAIGQETVAEIVAPDGLPLIYLLIGSTSMPWPATPGRVAEPETVANGQYPAVELSRPAAAAGEGSYGGD